MGDDAPRKGRLFPRFSLRFLLLLVLLIASGLGLWWRWEPWVVLRRTDGEISNSSNLRFSPDGNRLVLYDESGKIQVRDVKNGSQVWEAKESQLLSSNAAFSQDQSRLVVRFNQRTIVFDAASGKKLQSVTSDPTREGSNPGPIGPVLDVAPNGIQYVKNRLFLSEFGRELPISKLDANSYVFSKDGLMLLTLHNDNTLRVLNAGTGKVIRQTSWPNSETASLIMADSEVSFILYLGKDERIHTWDIIAEGNFPPSFDPPKDIRGLKISPNGERIMIWGRRIEIGHLKSGRLVKFSDSEIKSESEPTFSYDSSRVLATAKPIRGLGQHGSHAILQDVHTGAELCKLKVKGQSVFDCRFSPVRNTIAMTTVGGNLIIWHRRRPEYWWGITYLPTFWLTTVFGIGLVWSLFKDWRTLRRPKAKAA